MLNITDLYKRFDGVEIGPFDLSVENDKIVAIIGKSGSGKSTLVKMITGVLTPDKGSVEYNNDSLDDNDYIYISQIGTLFNHLTIEENLRLTFKGDIKEILKTLKEVKLDESFLNKYPFELSGGEKQRVDLIRAIISKAEIMILDESLSALDAKTKDDIYDVINELKEKHKLMILIITHDLEEAIFFSDSIVLLESGKIKFQGESKDLLNVDNDSIKELVSEKRLERLKRGYINE